MRYKTMALQKIDQIDSSLNVLRITMNRQSQDQMLETLELLKEQLQQFRDLISSEHDDFAQEFKK